MMRYQSLFDQVFDVAVLGGGYAAWGAAMVLRDMGFAVLLLEPGGDLLWESGRCFCPDAGTSAHEPWTWLTQQMVQRGVPAGWHDGAIAEALATDRLVTSGVKALYYHYPVAVERDGTDRVTAVLLAGKSGLRRVAARQWVDATDEGQLLKLMAAGQETPAARPEHHLFGYFTRSAWPDNLLEPAGWPTQRLARLKLDPSQSMADGLLALIERNAAARGDGVMSHASFAAYPVYHGGRDHGDVANVACACAMLTSASTATLAQRLDRGIAAAQRVRSLPRASAAALAAPLPAVVAARTIDTDVLVAGAGTGGVIAAIAAGEQGARVVCVEPAGWVGGIGTAGGIHSYYIGVSGGIQEQVDQRVRALMDRYPDTLRSRAFNPYAKRIVLEQMLAEAGVQLMTRTLLYGVEMQQDTVTAGHLAGASGPLRVRAHSYIDGTGDGDLCMMAGAQFTLGREGDGLPHAYTQSAGYLSENQGKHMVAALNYDSGWCDPTDPEDFTRARLVGVAQHVHDHYVPAHRPTYIAPAIGLRQARQVITDTVMSLSDLVLAQRFDDAVGLTGCHNDNHAVDYELESDEQVFWVWFNRQWRTPLACWISYRMLLPVGVSNVWIGSRCLGVSQDAHHTMRMQRDMQRIGEVAGIAAAWAARQGVPSRQVDIAALQSLLTERGAMSLPSAERQAIFNPNVTPTAFDVATDEGAVRDALAALDRGELGRSMWLLYRRREQVEQEVLARLASKDDRVSWAAAGIVAMWGDERAEPRLLRAVQTREMGPVEGETKPNEWRFAVPNWMSGATILRCCGTAACLPALADLAKTPDLGVNPRNAIARTVQRIAQRHRLTPQHKTLVLEILEQLLEGEVPDATAYAVRPVGGMAALAMAGQREQTRELAGKTIWGSKAAAKAAEDHLWQLHLSVAQARVAVGVGPHEQAKVYLHDARSLVRRAFRAVVRD